MGLRFKPSPKCQNKETGSYWRCYKFGTLFRLSDKKWIDLARYSFDNLKKLKESEGKKLPANINPPNNLGAKDKIIRRLDCAVIQNIHQLLEINDITPFDSVRGVFFEGNPLYDGAGFHDKTHVQIWKFYK